MKKVILLFLAVWAVGSIMAQSLQDKQSEKGITSFRGQNPTTVVYQKANFQPNAAKTTLSEGFEGANFPPAGWSILDTDNDGGNFLPYTAGTAHTGTISAASASWTSTAGPLTPNNHLITPALIPTAGDTNFSFWYAAQDPDYPSDKFQILVSTAGKAAANFTDTLWVNTITDSTWTQKTLSLADYIGDTIYVSINHWDCTDWFMMKIDDVAGPAVYVAPDMAITNISEPNNGCSLGSEDVTIEITNNGDASVSSFTIAFKVDNGAYTTETYNGTAIPAFGSAIYTFTAKANLATIGIYNITAKVTFAGDSDPSNDEYSTTVENFNGKTIPFTMGFETGESLDGWSIIDVANDLSMWYTIESGANPNTGTGYVYCPTPSSDDWLITPCLNLQTGVSYSVSSWVKTKPGGNESFSFMLGQTPDAAGLTTNLKDATVVADVYDLVASAPFTVTTSGLFYIGVHANSTSSAMTLYLDDFMVDDVFTGINTTDAELNISMFPNPASNVLKIRSSIAINQISITNVIGQKLIQSNPNSDQSILDISTLENGVYFVTIETGAVKSVKKLTIKK